MGICASKQKQLDTTVQSESPPAQQAKIDSPAPQQLNPKIEGENKYLEKTYDIQERAQLHDMLCEAPQIDQEAVQREEEKVKNQEKTSSRTQEQKNNAATLGMSTKIEDIAKPLPELEKSKAAEADEKSKLPSIASEKTQHQHKRKKAKAIIGKEVKEFEFNDNKEAQDVANKPKNAIDQAEQEINKDMKHTALKRCGSDVGKEKIEIKDF